MSEPLLVWGLALLGVAFLLIAVEVFVPSAGLIAITAALAAVAGVVCMWMVSPVWGLTGLVLTLVLAPIVFMFLLNVMPNTPLGRRLIGTPSPEEQEQRHLDERRQHDERAALIGAEGTAITDMRPVGKVEVDGRRYEALAETHAIDAGTPVRITGATMLEIKVRPAG